jgi:hypothetical protein
MVRLNNISVFAGKFLILSLFLCISISVNAQNIYPEKSNGKYGYISVGYRPTFVIKPQFTDADKFSEGLAAVETKGKWGYIDVNGKFIVKPQFEGRGEFTEGLAAVKLNGKWGFINTKGKFVINPQFEHVGPFSNGLAGAKLSDTWGYVDKNGQFVINPQFDIAYRFHVDGLAIVKLNGKWGYIEKNGQFVIKPQFDHAESFSNGLAVVGLNGKLGYIDKTGQFVVKPQFNSAHPFSNNGVAQVSLNGHWRYIDIYGNIYTTYDEATAAMKEQTYLVKIGESYGSFMKRIIPSWEIYLQGKNIQRPSELSSESLKLAVERKVNAWQQKGEFESSSEWQQRVNEEARAAKVKEITAQIRSDYSQKVQEYNNQIAIVKLDYENEYRAASDKFCLVKAKIFAQQDFELKSYDADNETFLISSASAGDIILPVPKAKAAQFKSNWNNIKAKVEATFVPVGDDVALKSVTFGDYTFDGNTKENYALTNIDYNFAPIEISNVDLAMSDYNFEQISSAPTITVSNPEAKTISATKVNPESRTLAVGSASDVDLNIPQSKATAKNTFAIVIANENYQNVERVENAANDGKIMAKYLTSTLGIPQDQVMTYTDASYGNMIDALDRIKNISQAYSGSDYNVIFYYAGHGVPDEQSHEAYLLPIDGKPGSTAVNIPLSKLYATLGDLGASAVYVMLDACFSGSQRGDGMLAQARGVAIKAKAAEPKGNMVVLSAAQGDETAYPYKGQNHGMFTYYLLKKLQESSGNVTIGELADYVIDNVKKTSVIKNNGKIQTPSVRASLSSGESWRNNKLVK